MAISSRFFLILPLFFLSPGQYGLPPKKDPPAGRATNRHPGKQQTILESLPRWGPRMGMDGGMKQRLLDEKDAAGKSEGGGDRWRMCSGDICGSLYLIPSLPPLLALPPS